MAVERAGSILKCRTSTLLGFYQNPAGLKIIKNAPEAPQACCSAEAHRRSPVPPDKRDKASATGRASRETQGAQRDTKRGGTPMRRCDIWAKPRCRQAAFTSAPRTPAARNPALAHAAADGRSGGSQPAAARRRGQAGAAGGRRGRGPAAVPEAHRSERAELRGPAAASPASRAGQRQRSPCTCPR